MNHTNNLWTQFYLGNKGKPKPRDLFTCKDLVAKIGYSILRKKIPFKVETIKRIMKNKPQVKFPEDVSLVAINE